MICSCNNFVPTAQTSGVPLPPEEPDSGKAAPAALLLVMLQLRWSASAEKGRSGGRLLVDGESGNDAAEVPPGGDLGDLGEGGSAQMWRVAAGLEHSVSRRAVAVSKLACPSSCGAAVLAARHAPEELLLLLALMLLAPLLLGERSVGGVNSPC